MSEGEVIINQVRDLLLAAHREGLPEAYVVLVQPDGSASVYAGKTRPRGDINMTGGRTRGTDLGLILDQVVGPLNEIAADARMAGFDDLPPEVRALIHEYGIKAKALWEEGYDASMIPDIIKSET